MKLEDLRTGMRVKLRKEEGYYIVQVIEEGFGYFINENSSFMLFENYTGDLKGFGYKDNRNYDIVEVYNMPPVNKMFDFNAKGKLLWSEKQESEEVKMDAVEFLKTQRRICEEYEAGVCTDCPFDNANELCSFYTDDEEEVVRKVEHWSKQHPEIELTEQQITAVKGRIAEGARWVYREFGIDNLVFFVDKKPKRGENYFITDKEWEYFRNGKSDFYNFVTFENSPIYLPDLLKENENE